MIVLLFSISIVEENSSTIKTEPECFSLLVIQDSHRFNKGIKFLILIGFLQIHIFPPHRTYASHIHTNTTTTSNTTALLTSVEEAT